MKNMQESSIVHLQYNETMATEDRADQIRLSALNVGEAFHFLAKVFAQDYPYWRSKYPNMKMWETPILKDNDQELSAWCKAQINVENNFHKFKVGYINAESENALALKTMCSLNHLKVICFQF